MSKDDVIYGLRVKCFRLDFICLRTLCYAPPIFAPRCESFYTVNMFDKSSLPSWLKKLIALGDAPSRPRSDTNKRAYRTVYYRYFWAMAFALAYFLLAAYRLGGDDSGSSDNSGIYKLLIGAVLVGGLGAFFAPRLNLALQKLFPEGRRREADRKRRQSKSRSQGSVSRSSSRSSSGSSSRSSTHSSSRSANTSTSTSTRTSKTDLLPENASDPASDGLTQTKAKPKRQTKPKPQSGSL